MDGSCFSMAISCELGTDDRKQVLRMDSNVRNNVPDGVGDTVFGRAPTGPNPSAPTEMVIFVALEKAISTYGSKQSETDLQGHVSLNPSVHIALANQLYELRRSLTSPCGAENPETWHMSIDEVLLLLSPVEITMARYGKGIQECRCPTKASKVDCFVR